MLVVQTFQILDFQVLKCRPKVLIVPAYTLQRGNRMLEVYSSFLPLGVVSSSEPEELSNDEML